MSNRKKKESWMTHYCNKQKMLVVGEGEFSFSACLARGFQPATRIVATSFDSQDTPSNSGTSSPAANLSVISLQIHTENADHISRTEENGERIGEICSEELKNAVLVDEDLKASNQKATAIVEQRCQSPSPTDSGDKSLPDPTSCTTTGAFALHQCGSSCVFTNENTDQEIIKDRKQLVVADFDDHLFPNPSSTIGATTLHPSASSGLLNDLDIQVARIVELKIEDYNQLKTNERKITHYSNFQKILLVGEGDFSFSACLARAFGSAVNMVATSLDSEERLSTRYRTADENIEELRSLGCLVLHEVDVNYMNIIHPLLRSMKFDRIVFNFPHAGHFRKLCERDIPLVKRHKRLLSAFFRSSSKMLNEDGEVHVAHRDDYPYNTWEIEKLANEAGLGCIEKVKFWRSDYPGYSNKRGSCSQGRKFFPVGYRPFTFKFSSSTSTRCVNFLDTNSFMSM